MSHQSFETFSSPSSSAKDYDGTGTSLASTRTSPSTPQSGERHRSVRSSLDIGPALLTPNDVRRLSLADTRHGDPSINTREPDAMDMDAQAKFYHQKLQDLDEAYMIKIRNLERENAKLIVRSIDPSYVTDLETQYQDLWDTKDTLSAQIDELKLENKKLKDSNKWQQQELEHISRDRTQKVTATNPVDVVPQGYSNAGFMDLREQLSAAREENAELYEKCTALEQEIDNLKSQDSIATSIGDRLKLIKVTKDAMLCEEGFVSMKMDLDRLHHELDGITKSGRTYQEGTMLFEAGDLKAELDAKSRMVEDLKAQLREQQDRIEELSVERGFGESPNLMAELENVGTMSSASSLVDEVIPYGTMLEHELKYAKDQLVEERANNLKLLQYMRLLDKWMSEKGLQGLREQLERHSKFNAVGNLLQELEPARSEDLVFRPIEESSSPHISFIVQPQLEEMEVKVLDADEETIAQYLQRLFINLWEGRKCIFFNPFRDLKLTMPVDAHDQDVMPSFSSSISLHSTSFANPSLTGRLWTEILWAVCAGNEYWTEVAISDRAVWIKVQGPWFWSLIIQILMFTLVSSLTVAWWCIMTASAERELWLAANEITIKKYWDTAIWGAERDLLWRLCYGLGFV